MQTALEAIGEYYKAFSSLNLSAITFHFAEPCMSVGPQGSFAAENREALARAFTPLVESLRAKGYERSEFIEPRVTTLNETAALVQGKAVRFANAGVEIERLPISYLMHRTGADWKIAVMVL